MYICGNICINEHNEEFLLKCIHCTGSIEISKWHEFVLHIRNLHSANFKIYKPNNDAALDDCSDDKMLRHSLQEITVKSESKEFLDENEIEQEIPLPLNDVQLQLESSEFEYKERSEFGNDSEHELDLQSNTHTSSDENETTPTNNEITAKFNPTFFRRNERTDYFIELYKAHPCLWNSNHAQFDCESARTNAYRSLISNMRIGAGVLFTERKLKSVIKKLHEQFNATGNRIVAKNQKINAVVLHYYEKCSFLCTPTDKCTDNVEDENDKIKLVFTEQNDETTEFIALYAKYPQLYDPKHKDFSNIKARKTAYEKMLTELHFKVADINDDDVFKAIQTLRQWYYKREKLDVNPQSDIISLAEKFYLEKCNFLPPRMFKQRLFCENCKKLFFSDLALQAHMYKEHKIGELPFKCAHCERSFDNRTDLYIHKQRVHIGKVHKCSYCERSFAVYADLKLHYRTHTGNKPYVCEQCGKAFRVKTQLGYHVTAIHTKIRAFKCDLCPKDFLKKRDLKDHIKAHLNIRDKICETCGKGFTNSHSLIRHRQIHAEVKKFVCKLCDARFSQFVGLNSHMKRSHNIVRGIPKEMEASTATQRTGN